MSQFWEKDLPAWMSALLIAAAASQFIETIQETGRLYSVAYWEEMAEEVN